MKCFAWVRWCTMTHTPYNSHAQPHETFPTLQKKSDYYSLRAESIMARTALFVIDIQGELAQDATTEIPHAARIREAGTAILQRARQAIASASEHGTRPDLEIVFVQHEEVAETGALVKGSMAWELVFRPQGDNRWERLVSKDVREWVSSS